MLSYRHAFHAGNHADVLKHAVLVTVLDYLNQKDKPWWYIDTHAGAGLYDLDSEHARKTGEFSTGIARVWRAEAPPALLRPYLALVRELNADGVLRQYPGSPWLARACARPEDRLRLFELHSTDTQLLSACFGNAGRQVRTEQVDGYAGLKSVLPPLSRRAVTLIDPSYEIKTDYQRTVEALADSLVRFASGTYMLWYPLLQSGETRPMLQSLRSLSLPSWLNVSLTVQSPSTRGFGMHGSGLFIINPPWTLPAALAEVLPWLTGHLGLDAGAGFTLDHHIP